MKHLLSIFATLLLISKAPAEIYQERGGIVAIEAESTSSKLGEWKKKTDVEDFSGECHLEFTGNKPENGPPKSPLKYRFKINKAGTYQLTLRARKRLETKREDISNDCYIALKGDFTAGGEAPLKTLRSDTKMYGGKADGWAWTRNLDASHKKFPALYVLKAGEVYELTISGRSRNFNLDRILITHDTVDLRKTQKDNPSESKAAGTGLKFGPRAVTRTLTNKDGKCISAKLIRKNADDLVIEIRGRRHEIPIASLSKQDQDFIREWQPAHD